MEGKISSTLFAQTPRDSKSGVVLRGIPKASAGSDKLNLSEESVKEDFDMKTYSSHAERIRGEGNACDGRRLLG